MAEVKFNLGCGKDIREGCVNVDTQDLPGVDYICNLNAPRWGLGESVADEVIAQDIFEHLDDIINAMDNCAQLLKSGGLLTIRAPHDKSELIWLDPTHRRGFNVRSFDYFDQTTELGKQYPYGAFDWRIESKVIDGGNVIVKMRVVK